MVCRECTRHNWCSLWKISQVGEVKSALPDMNSLLLALVLIISARSLSLILPHLWAHFCKVIRAPTFKTTVVVVRVSGLLKVRPRAGLLLLWWSIASLLLLLLRRSNNPTPWLRGLMRRCSRVLCTMRYLGAEALEGPVGALRFFSVRCAEMRSSWVMARFTKSLKE